MAASKRTVCKGLLLSTFVMAGISGWSQSKMNQYSAPINHPSINASAPYVSLEGNSMLFVSDNAEDNLLTVFWTTKPDGVNWKEPVALPKTLNGRLNFLNGFALSADGRQAYISTTKGGGLGGYDIYVSDLKGTYWGEPANVGQPVNSKENEACPSVTTENTTMYFMRCTTMNANKASGCKIMVSTRRTPAANWQAPTELPANINTGNSQAPRIMGDGESLIFSSDQMGGKGGMDLFITKKTGTSWSKPVPLDFANSERDDQFVSANSLGRYLVTNMPTKTATQLVDVLFPADVKPKAVMKVEGRVEGPANPASPYVNLMDGKTQQRLLTVRPTKEGSFVLYLPEGKVYSVVVDPEEDNYTFFSHEYDLTGEKISTLEKLNVTLKSVAAGDVIELAGVQFKEHSSEMLESSKAELRKVARLINGSPSMKFNVEVDLYGYQKDSVRSNPDLTEIITDTLHFTVKRTLTDSTGAMTTLQTDSVAVKHTYHNDRTQHQALEVVNHLIEQGIPANRVMPANKLFDAIPEERKTVVKLIARQQ
ncbi:MAG TPA: hypothetical protein VFE50_05765 [Cyclobacteriaceae bacterium]|nr:hypothetical protein [Cyclobacteriaceae bacterium]